MKTKILVIDDDIDMCVLLNRFLSKNGYDVDTAHSAQGGIEKFKEIKPEVVLCDYRLGDKKSGKDVLTEIKAINPATIVIIITGYSDIKTAIDVIKIGAYDYIAKPLIPDEVLTVVKNSIASLDGFDDEKNPKARRSAIVAGNDYLVGIASSTKELYKQIEIVAPTDFSIILYGESGTGKEVIARTIHEKSSRKDKPFIAMDCGTLSKELAGSELFGHVKGSFTGAIADKEGHFELANGGTLFLDEVANLSPETQASLLRVIQERKLKRIGGNKEIHVDVRIIVASNENLQDAYRKGKFREDLYHRFNEFSINIQPLRNRREDIPLFAEFFLNKTKTELKKEIAGFEPEIMNMFINYAWPGNLREFRNVIRRSVLLAPNDKITVDSLPWEIISSVANTATAQSIKSKDFFQNEIPLAPVREIVDLKDAASKAEYETIMMVLKEVNFNKTKAAEVLKIDRKTLYNKIKGYEEIQRT